MARSNPDQQELRAIIEAGGSALANAHKGLDDELIAWAIAIAHGKAVNIGRSDLKHLPGLPECGWDNRFEMRGESAAERDRVCKAHDGWLDGQTDLLARLDELRGKVLVCWCWPKRCHGESFLRRLS